MSFQSRRSDTMRHDVGSALDFRRLVGSLAATKPLGIGTGLWPLAVRASDSPFRRLYTYRVAFGEEHGRGSSGGSRRLLVRAR